MGAEFRTGLNGISAAEVADHKRYGCRKLDYIRQMNRPVQISFRFILHPEKSAGDLASLAPNLRQRSYHHGNRFRASPEKSVSRGRLALVPRDVDSGDRRDSSGPARTRRSLHVSSANRFVHGDSLADSRSDKRVWRQRKIILDAAAAVAICCREVVDLVPRKQTGTLARHRNSLELHVERYAEQRCGT